MRNETGLSGEIFAFNKHNPKIDASVFMCHGSIILGDVEIGKDSSVWFNTVIRGDVHYIKIGERTNIQDLCMLHCTYQKHPLNIGNNVTIGHSAILHGCTIHHNVLIGMGAKILDRCVVNSNTLIAAGTVLPEGTEIPSGVLVAGVPGKVIRNLREDEIKKIAQSADNYVMYVEEYRKHVFDK